MLKLVGTCELVWTCIVNVCSPHLVTDTFCFSMPTGSLLGSLQSAMEEVTKLREHNFALIKENVVSSWIIVVQVVYYSTSFSAIIEINLSHNQNAMLLLDI